jgi:hypothetical protein
MTDAISSGASSSASIIEDIMRLIPKYEHWAFHEMLQTELYGRAALPDDEMRRVAVNVRPIFYSWRGSTWHKSLILLGAG